MLKYFSVLLIALIHLTVYSQPFTLEDILLKNKYSPKRGYKVNFTNTGAEYTLLKTNPDGYQVLSAYDVVSEEKTRTLFDASKMQSSLNIQRYTLSDDDRMVLFATDVEKIYRHSIRANYYTYDIYNQALTSLFPGAKQMYPRFSPDNKKIGFVIDNNLYYKEMASGNTTQVTNDGKFNHIINGHSDWVYEEEFKLKRAYEWSADGQQLLFIQFDESAVREFSYMEYGELYPEVVTFKYPKAGEENSKVSLKIYDLASGKLNILDIPFDYEYIPRIYATEKGFAFLLMNRAQNHIQLIDYDPATNNFDLIYEEQDKYYIELPGVLQHLAGENWMISSMKDGYNHLYTIINKNVKAVTQGDFDVTEFYGIDGEGWIYFQSTEESNVQRHLYKQQLNTTNKKQLTNSRGYHSAKFSGDLSYYIHKYSGDGIPFQITVNNNNGTALRIIEMNKALRERLAEQWSHKDFFEVQLDGYALNAWMIKPKNFNPSKTYPLLMFQYSGPGSQRVIDQWARPRDFWFQMLAQQGFIVACVDGRGTGYKGTEFQKKTYKQLGKYELEDQVNSAKYFGSLSFIDANQIGIFGWSYGGTMAALCLFSGQGVFKVALSVASVTNWRYYDTIYTERYMGDPNKNAEGYDGNSPIFKIEQWNEGELFLAHGVADDNVHFQNTVELVEALNSSGKQYDFYAYPSGNHGIGGYDKQYHLYTKMTNFLRENLISK